MYGQESVIAVVFVGEVNVELAGFNVFAEFSGFFFQFFQKGFVIFKGKQFKACLQVFLVCVEFFPAVYIAEVLLSFFEQFSGFFVVSPEIVRGRFRVDTLYFFKLSVDVKDAPVTPGLSFPTPRIRTLNLPLFRCLRALHNYPNLVS